VRSRTIALIGTLAIAQADASTPIGPVTFESQESGTTVRLRGISAVDGNIAWASGREGTVLRTTDGGKHWKKVSVPDAKDLDFRDIEAFDANNAVVLSIGPGEASRVYRTQDGGKHWALALKNTDERAFFDCMVFDGANGWMLGDPVEGRYQVRTTTDGGRTWALSPDGPEAMKDEAAFAASGTCIARTTTGETLAVGGGAAARAHVGDSSGKRWTAIATSMTARVPAAGIFSATPMGKDMLLVGGDFEHAEQGSSALVHFDPAEGATAEALPAPLGYRSGVACFTEVGCIAVGPDGADSLHSFPDGRYAWFFVDGGDVGYDAIDVAGDVGWASGDKGRIARVTPISVTVSSSPQRAAPPSKQQPATPPSK
jgi:photosystem II stability/assembly factor-like uncharacterized protein